MEKSDLQRFMVEALFEEIQIIKAELRLKGLGEGRKHMLRQSLRFLCRVLADILSMLPEEMTDDEVAKIIKRVPDKEPRRMRTRLEQIITSRKASMGS